MDRVCSVITHSSAAVESSGERLVAAAPPATLIASPLVCPHIPTGLCQSQGTISAQSQVMRYQLVCVSHREPFHLRVRL